MNTLVDDKLREAVWQTKIPIKIDMAIEDINDIEKPSSLFVLLSLFRSLISPEIITSLI